MLAGDGLNSRSESDTEQGSQFADLSEPVFVIDACAYMAKMEVIDT